MKHMSVPKILVVEDEEDIREGINILLTGENYEVVDVGSGEEALERMDETIDLVILDVMLPGISGIKVCQEIRKDSIVPILFLTAKSQESDKTIGFMAGGDDYLVKPFSYAELTARVKAMLRRYCVYKGKDQTTSQEEEKVLQSKELRVSMEYNEVFKRDKEINLTGIEYNILRLLMQSPQKVFSTQNIFETVWNMPYDYSANSTVMVHIRNLRTKLEDDPQNPVYIKTVWGKGYRYEDR